MATSSTPPDDAPAGGTTGTSTAGPGSKRDRTHWLYIAVIVAVLAGIAM